MYAKISADSDGLEARLTLTEDDGIPLIASSITDALDADGVCFGIDIELIKKIISDVEDIEKEESVPKEAPKESSEEDSNKKIETSFIVAKAKKQKAGKSGKIDFKVETDRQHHADSKSDKVDYRESVHIESVKQGQILAEIIPPTEGTPGTSIYGKPIPAKDGRPIKVKAGKNVELRGDTLVATSEGVINKVGSVLSVSPVYEVRGGVDMEVGNIDFTGTVIIGGDVGDDFTVKAGGDIQVSGTVGKANLISEGNITINGGFNGKDKGLLAAQGEVSVKYINHGNVRAAGSVIVKKEINNSIVYTLDKIDISRGGILGGSVMALHGIKAAFIGSELGVKTIINVGSHYKLFAIEEKLEKLNEVFADIEKKIDPFIGKSHKFDELPDARKAELTNMREICKESRESWLAIQKKMKPLINDSRDRTPEVIILKTVYPDVVLRTKNCFRKLNEELVGPLKATEDVENSTMQIGKVE